LAAWRLTPTARARWRLLWSSGLVVAGIVAASYLSLPEGVRGLVNLQGRTDLFTHSLPAIVKLLLGLALPQETAMLLAGLATALAFLGYVLVQLANAWLQPQDAVRLAFNVLLFLLLTCMSWFQPWYLIWIVPLAAVYPRPNAPFQMGLFALCTSWSYIVFGFVWFWIISVGSWGKGLGIESLAVTNTYALSWIYAIVSGLREKGRKQAVS
jgi:hypothetical protein